MRLYVILLAVLAFCIFPDYIPAADNSEIKHSSNAFPENVVALVNEDAVTVAELKEQLRTRRKKIEEITIEYLNDILDKLINRRLIVQEAYRMGLEEDSLIIKDRKNYIRIQSIIRFREDFIREVKVSEKEVLEVIKNDYEKMEVEILFLEDEEKAGKLFSMAENGKELASLVEDASYWKGAITRKTYGKSSPITEAVFSSEIGKLLFVETEKGKFIIKVLDKISVTREMQVKLSPDIETKIRFEKSKITRKALYDELLNKAVIEVNDDLLSKLESEKLLMGNKDWQSDSRVLATINGEPITVEAFLSKYKSYLLQHMKISKEPQEEKNKKALEVVIGTTVESQAALSRDYYQKSAVLRGMVKRHQERVMYNLFFQRVILPKIEPSTEDLEKYYRDNVEFFSRPDSIALKAIVVIDKGKAANILRELQKGANINFLADSFSVPHKYDGWKLITELPEPIAREVGELQVGEISGIIAFQYNFHIVKIVGRKEGEPYPFQAVRKTAEVRYIKEKGRELLKEMAVILRKNSEIKINTSLLAELQESLLEQKSEKEPGS